MSEQGRVTSWSNWRINPKRLDFRRGMDVDMVFIVGGSPAMKPLLDVCGWMPDMFTALEKRTFELCRKVEHGRAKLVWFGDLYRDANAYRASEFFDWSEAAERLAEFTERENPSELLAEGPKSALETISRVMRETEFCGETHLKRRHFIFLITDCPAYRLDDPRRAETPEYPADMPNTLAGVEDIWEQMDPCAKRLIISSSDTGVCRALGLWTNAFSYPTCLTDGALDRGIVENAFCLLGGI